MSIIYDALKKVERSQNINPEIKINKADKARHKIYLIYALVVVLGFFAANLLWGFLIKPLPAKVNVASGDAVKIAKAQEIKPVGQRALEAQVSIPAAPTPAPSPAAATPETKPELTLNGIFFSEDEGYALINNQIVKQGDTVDGAKVVRIDVAEVELESQGSVIKLSCSK